MERFKITVADTEYAEELTRTLTTLFATRAGSQPADRDFGIDWSLLDEIPEVAESLFALEAIKKGREVRTQGGGQRYRLWAYTRGHDSPYLCYGVTAKEAG